MHQPGVYSTTLEKAIEPQLTASQKTTSKEKLASLLLCTETHS